MLVNICTFIRGVLRLIYLWRVKEYWLLEHLKFLILDMIPGRPVGL